MSSSALTPPRKADHYRISDAKYVVLRQEIIETHRSSADFMKWKLLAVAAIGSVAVGFLSRPGAPASPEARLIVCLAPLVCAYADLVNMDLAVRVMVIANFLRRCDDPYEEHVNTLRQRDPKDPKGAAASTEPRRGSHKDPFNAATFASFMASLFVNVLIMAGGAWGSYEGWPSPHFNFFMGAGGAGVLGTLLLLRSYGARLDRASARSNDDAHPLDPCHLQWPK